MMLVIEKYYRTGAIVYLWSKYLWQQMLEQRQRNVLDAYKSVPIELRGLIDEEQYENNRNVALYRSGFEMIKRTVNVGVSTALILLQGFRKLWEKSFDIVAYFGIQDSDDIIKNALFLSMLSSGTFLISLPFAMLETRLRQSQNRERISATNILLGHSVAQTLLFPFICLFIVAFKLGGNRSLFWAFGFVEFQLLTDYINFEITKPLQSSELKTELEKIAEKYKFPLYDVFVSRELREQQKISLQGFPQPRTITISHDLIRRISGNEEEIINIQDIGILVAREMSHWKHGHSYINFVASQTHLCLHMYTIYRAFNSSGMYEAFGFNDRPLAVGLTLLQYCPLFDLYNFIGRKITRHLEFVVDCDVKKIYDVVSVKKAIVKVDDRAKLFPVQDSFYSICYNSVPSVYERIKALNESN